MSFPGLYENGKNYSSPDIGSFTAKNGILYTSTGHIYPDTALIRVSGFTWDDEEDYSLWSDEKRETVKAEYEAKWAKNRQESAERELYRKSLVESAREKLTEEEFEAVVLEGSD